MPAKRKVETYQLDGGSATVQTVNNSNHPGFYNVKTTVEQSWTQGDLVFNYEARSQTHNGVTPGGTHSSQNSKTTEYRPDGETYETTSKSTMNDNHSNSHFSYIDTDADRDVKYHYTSKPDGTYNYVGHTKSGDTNTVTHISDYVFLP